MELLELDQEFTAASGLAFNIGQVGLFWITVFKVGLVDKYLENGSLSETGHNSQYVRSTLLFLLENSSAAVSLPSRMELGFCC